MNMVNRSRPKIALDFDGVLSHTMKRWVEIYNADYSEKYNKVATIRDINVWAFFEPWGMEKDEAFRIFDSCWEGWSHLEALETDLQQKTKMLNNIGDVDIVTSVNEQWLPQIRKWADKHGVICNKVIHSKAKHELDYDIYIDDSPQNVKEMYEAGKIVMMINQPWNRDIEEKLNWRPDRDGCIKRVYNLYHVIDELRNMGYGKSKE